MKKAAEEAETEISAEKTEAEDVTNEEAQQITGQADTSQPASETTTEETFAKSFDPSKLPPELQGVYKSMQGDYTRKTTELAELRKQAESIMRFKPVLDRIVADPNLFNQIMGLRTEEAGEEELPDDPKEFAQYLENRAVERVKNELAIEQDIQTAVSVDDRLADENFAKMIYGLVIEDPEVKSGQKTFTQATKEAINAFDQYMAGIKSETRDQLIKSAQNKKMVTSKSSTPVGTMGSKIKTFRDAYKAALEETGI